jgi:hypothetical protein
MQLYFYVYESIVCVYHQERTQRAEYYTFHCHLLQGSAIFGHHQVDHTTYKKNVVRST